MKKLTNDKLEKIAGGVKLAEYCGTLGMIMNNGGISAAGLTAWDANCGGTYGDFHYY
ncbi:MAG TPA: hypothetical protein PKL31_08085 [Fulvivirga sp.]|nr:hypothetical protein [Fulvivirga sp.]